MVDRKDPLLPVVSQCQLLAVPHSTFYYRCQSVLEANLALMRLIDECHLSHPYYGSRRIRGWLVGSKPCSQPHAGAATDAENGPGGTISQTQPEPVHPGTPDLPVYLANPK